MTVITMGKKLVPLAHIAFVEPFDPAANPEFNPERAFKPKRLAGSRTSDVVASTAPAIADEKSAPTSRKRGPRAKRLSGGRR